MLERAHAPSQSEWIIGGLVPTRVVSLFDADPELAELVPVAERLQARRRAAVRVLELAGPQWSPEDVNAEALPEWFGLLVLRGALVRRVRAASRTGCEILGSGDIFRPWDEDGDHDPLIVGVDWQVLAPTQLAVLDDAFASGVACWPRVSARLMQRTAARARRLGLTAAVTHLPRIHARLLLIFWLLADRWGAVTSDGVVVKLGLTHEVLAALVGSHRPSVTTALKRLSGDGLLFRGSANRWLLTHKALDLLRSVESLSLLDGHPGDEMDARGR